MASTNKTGDGTVYIRKTPSLNRFIFFLSDCASQNAIDKEELDDLKKLLNPDEKLAFQLVLTGCLEEKDLASLFPNKREDILSSLLDLLDPEEMDTLSLETYFELVTQLELLEQLADMLVKQDSVQTNALPSHIQAYVQDFVVALEKSRREQEELLKLESEPKLTKEELEALELKAKLDRLDFNHRLEGWEFEEFKGNLHKMLLQLSSIEFENDESILKTHQTALVNLCLQNPAKVLQKVLEQSIQTEHLRALEYLRPFYLLVPPRIQDADLQADETSLIVQCFAKTLGYFPEYPDGKYDALSNCLELIISRNILSANEIFLVMKNRIVQLMKSKRVSLAHVTGVVKLVESLTQVIPVSETELLDKIALLSVQLNRFLCLYTNSKTFVDAMKTRIHLVAIINYLSPLVQRLKREITPNIETEIEDLSLCDQGLLYIRCEQLRPLIIKALEQSNVDFKDAEDFVQTCLVVWILNSSEPDWDSLIDFLFNVIIAPTSGLSRLKKANKIKLLNQTLMLLYCTNVETKCVDAFIHALRFYSLAIEGLQDSFKEVEWYDLLETLLTIAVSMTKANKRRHANNNKWHREKEIPGLHLVLSLALRKIEDCVRLNLGITRYDKLVGKVNLLSDLDSNCEPVRWLISEKIKFLEKACSA